MKFLYNFIFLLFVGDYILALNGDSDEYETTKNTKFFETTRRELESELNFNLSSWQLQHNDIIKRTGHLLRTHIFSDCTFIVGAENPVEIKAHTLLLAAASPIFQHMFYDNPLIDGDINVNDLNPVTFNAILSYIYTNEVDISSLAKPIDLCYGAKKYMLPHLLQKCIDHLKKKMNVSNVIEVYEFGRMFGETELMNRARQVMSMKTKHVLKDSSFVRAKPSTLVSLLEMDNLNVDSEMDLIKAVGIYIDAHNNSKSDPVSENRKAYYTRVCRNDFNFQEYCYKVSPEHYNLKCEEFNENITIHDVIQKLRFLTLTSNEFVEHDLYKILKYNEVTAVLFNLVSRNATLNMPVGLSTNRIKRYMQQTTEQDFKLVLSNVTTRDYSQYVYSEDVVFRNSFWRLLARSNLQNDTKVLSLYFGTKENDMHSDPWFCDLKVNLKLLSHKEAKTRSYEYQRQFNRTNRDWGYLKFYDWYEMMNPSYGYVKNDAITLEGHATVNGKCDL